jgi:hypothetical protein
VPMNSSVHSLTRQVIPMQDLRTLEQGACSDGALERCWRRLL